MSENQLEIIKRYLQESEREELSSLEVLFMRMQQLPLVRHAAALTARLFSRGKCDKLSYVALVSAIAFLIYGVNYSALLYLAPGLFGARISGLLWSVYFNPLSLVVNLGVAVFSAWFTKLQSSKLMSTIDRIAHLLEFPSIGPTQPVSRRVNIDEILLKLFWNPLNSVLARLPARFVAAVICSVLIAVSYLLVKDFPIHEGSNLVLHITWLVAGSWIVAPLTWLPPKAYRGINRALWAIFRSYQPLVFHVFALSMVVGELTFYTFIPSMVRFRFFEETDIFRASLLRAEAYIGYVFLFTVLAGLAYISSASSVVVIFLSGKKYLGAIDPLDEHGCGGIGSVGELVERNVYGLTTVTVPMLASTLLVYREELTKPFYLQFAFGYAILVLFSYILPLLFVRHRVRQLKQMWFETLKAHKLDTWNKNMGKIFQSGVLGQETRSNLVKTTSKESWKATGEVAKSVRMMEMIRNIREWPGSLLSFVSVVLSSLAPLMTILAMLARF